MRSPILPLALLALLASCTGDQGELPQSGPADPSIDFDVPPPVVLTGWPCPPFDFATTEDKVGDSDADSMTDCQEEFIGTDPLNPDTDGDTVGDFFEVGDPADPLDTDNDTIIDLLDLDDDDDGVPTADEDRLDVLDGTTGITFKYGGNGDGDPRNDDWDGDGNANYVDPDDDNDKIAGRNLVAPVEGCPVCVVRPPVGFLFEDRSPTAPLRNFDGDPTNDDIDGDGIANRLDADDDGDGALTVDEDVNRNSVLIDDTDFDCTPDWFDLDDDGDGIPTADEDWDNSGTIMDDDLDNDSVEDFQDADEDGDSVRSVEEGVNVDTDNDGLPNYRDIDDDGDSVLTRLEDVELYYLVMPPADTGGGDETDMCPALPAPPVPEAYTAGFVTDDDTDADGIPNYLDADDDNDGCLTTDEDKDNNGVSNGSGDNGPNTIEYPMGTLQPVPYFLDGTANWCVDALEP
jgi:hypothetical protein